MFREYLKLARSYNAVLTGISPVMGAVAMEMYDIKILFLLFLVGFLGHTYGFILNDICDYRIDRSSIAGADRPLISGAISVRRAWILAFISLIAALIIAIYTAYITKNYFSLLILLISAFFVTLYDLTSKKFVYADFIITTGIFFIILYGSVSVTGNLVDVSRLAWIVCILGVIQVLYMQTIAGGLKDVENDLKSGGNTLAIKLGIRVIDGFLKIPLGFKTLAYSIQLVNIIVVFLPFFIVWDINNITFFNYIQGILLLIISIMMFIPTYKIFSMEKFERDKSISYMGIYYVFNFALVPIMLMNLNYWAGILVFFPGLGFILSNAIIHGTVFQPKNM